MASEMGPCSVKTADDGSTNSRESTDPRGHIKLEEIKEVLTLEVGPCGAMTADDGCTNPRESTDPRGYMKSEGIEESPITEEISCKREAATEGIVVNSLAQHPAKRLTLSRNVNVIKSTVALLPPTFENVPIHSSLSADTNVNGTCTAGSTDYSSQNVSLMILTHPLSQQTVKFKAKEGDIMHDSLRGGNTHQTMGDCRASSEVFAYEARAQVTDIDYETRNLPESLSPDSRDPSLPHESKVPSGADYASCSRLMLNHGNKSWSNPGEQPFPNSWSQDCFGLQKSSDPASNVFEAGVSCIDSTKGLCMGVANLCATQAAKSADMHSAEYIESIVARKTEAQSASSSLLLNEIVGATGTITGRSQFVDRLFDNFDVLPGDTNMMATSSPQPTGFSFQRLISGDITGFEHEFEENSNEDGGNENTDFGVERDEDDCDMYSTVCSPSTPSLSQSLEIRMEVQCSDSQDSDDMYHSHKGISICAPIKRGQSEDLDSEISEVPWCLGESASCSRLYKIHGSPCLQPKVDEGWQPASSDSSKDLYTEGIACSSRQGVWHGSPSLDSPTDVYQPTLPDASYLEGNAYSYSEHQYHGSPCMHPISKLDRQPSSDVSEDLSICPRSRDTPSNINRLKEETVNSSPLHSETIKTWVNRTEEGKLVEIPGTAKALLSSGSFDGYPVSYQAKGGGVLLTGIVKNGGILCNCRLCKGRTVVNVSCFEKHAGSTARHPSENIFFENGKSLHELLKAGWHSTDGKPAHIIHSGVKNNTNAESTYKDSNSLKTVTASQQKHRFDFSAPRMLQMLPPSQRRDLNKLLFLPGGLADGTEVAYYMKGQRMLTGTKMGHGILCDCCNEVISCSLFEAHAGWGSRRNPYQCIFLSDGRSLHKYAQSLAFKLQANSFESSRDNDDLCAECGDGGDLVLCDACPGAYHTECLGLTSIPEGEWFCPLCEENIEHARDDRKQGGDKSMQPFGQRSSIMTRRQDVERCQRVVKASDNCVGGCVICKNGDFLKTGFGAKTVLLCDQCEREFHVGCLKERAIVDLQELPAGEWFCGADCTRIHKILKELVLSGPKPVCRSICNAVLGMKGRQEERLQVSEFTWQLLHGRRGDPKNGKILSEAATIFAESFDPIVDAASGRDLISVMVHSRSIRDQDFGGMYCAVLKKKEVIVSTAVIRIFGRHFAEMPLVATSTAYRGQGFFQILMLNIEQLLSMLRVEHLVLPATSEAEGIWTKKFGFVKLDNKQVQKFESQVQIMMFQGSSMLSKRIPQQPSVM